MVRNCLAIARHPFFGQFYGEWFCALDLCMMKWRDSMEFLLESHSIVEKSYRLSYSAKNPTSCSGYYLVLQAHQWGHIINLRTSLHCSIAQQITYIVLSYTTISAVCRYLTKAAIVNKKKVEDVFLKPQQASQTFRETKDLSWIC